MIRRPIANMDDRPRPEDDLPEDLPEDDMADWRAWQERDYHEQLCGKDPLP